MKFLLLVAGLAWLTLARGLAGPPFLTDDPEPVDYQHWETYVFATGIHGPGSAYSINGPAVEMNYGVLPDTQLHLIVPTTFVGGGGVPSASGLGDTELGVKYRFRHETNGWPQIGVFPLVELPTGDSGRGLGNGRAWFRLPLWLQKSWGPWTSYGGGGAALNSAPGMRDYPFGGGVDTPLLRNKHGDSSGVRGAAWLWPQTAEGLEAATLKDEPVLLRARR